MVAKTPEPLTVLYEADETAWLEAMSGLVAEGRLADLDCVHLAEYLADMAKRDRREVSSRLALLIAHVLKWTYQPEKRGKSWQRTVLVQRQELARLLTSGTLRTHADAVLGEVYAAAVQQAMVDTDLDEEAFPGQCPWTLEQLLSADVLAE